MISLRIFSDLHLAQDSNKKQVRNIPVLDRLWYPPALPTDKEDVLVLAGDIWEDLKFIVEHNGESWLSRVASGFKHVLVVLGNHDYWDNRLYLANDIVKEYVKKFNNITVLDGDVVEIEDYILVGGTLWTDYNKNDPMALLVGRDYTKDNRKINSSKGKIDFRKTFTHDLINEHQRVKNVIEKECAGNKNVVVITHHAPSLLSLDDSQKINDLGNYCYASNLGDMICYLEPNLWIHGHIHQSKDYMIHNTRILSNPRGHVGFEGSNFDPHLRIVLP